MNEKQKIIMSEEAFTTLEAAWKVRKMHGGKIGDIILTSNTLEFKNGDFDCIFELVEPNE